MNLAITLSCTGLALLLLALWQQWRRQPIVQRLVTSVEAPTRRQWWHWPLPQAMLQHARIAALPSPWLGTVFWLSKGALAVSALVLAWPADGDPAGKLLSLVAAMLMQMLPDAWLRQQAQRTLRRSREQLPELLQLLALCLEAGLTLDRALPRLGSDLQGLNPALSNHLQRLSDDLRVVSERRQAFARLADRIPLDDFRQLCWLITQADDYGTPLAAGLRDLAQHSRSVYLLEVEERMARVPGQMAMPLMIFIIMPLVVLLAGPALVMLLRQLGGEA